MRNKYLQLRNEFTKGWKLFRKGHCYPVQCIYVVGGDFRKRLSLRPGGTQVHRPSQ
jgi:hypothetical protein